MTYLEGKKGIELVRHDIAKEPPPRSVLEKFVDGADLPRSLNSRSPKYKELGLGERTLTKKQAIDLMMDDPNLMKRPLVVLGSRAVFGYDEEGWDALLR